MLWDMAQLSNDIAAVERYDPTRQRLCSRRALRQTHNNCYAVSVISLLHQSTVLSAMADHIRDYITSTWRAAEALGNDFGCPNLPDHVAKTYGKLTNEKYVKDPSNLSEGGWPEELLVAFLLHGHVMNTEQLDYLVHSGLLRDTQTGSGVTLSKIPATLNLYWNTRTKRHLNRCLKTQLPFPCQSILGAGWCSTNSLCMDCAMCLHRTLVWKAES